MPARQATMVAQEEQAKAIQEQLQALRTEETDEQQLA